MSLQSAIQQNLAEVKQIRAKMQRDQAELEALRAQTDEKLKQIHRQLALLKAN